VGQAGAEAANHCQLLVAGRVGQKGRNDASHGSIVSATGLLPAATPRCLLLIICCWPCPAPPSPACPPHPAGSQTLQGEAVGFETEATAIMDTMAYIRPDIYTLVIGQAFGNAAMILASGKKGYRYALPNARIMTCPPRMNRCVRAWVLGGGACMRGQGWGDGLGRQALLAFCCAVGMAGAPLECGCCSCLLAHSCVWRIGAAAALQPPLLLLLPAC
jgi:hypothetical protein